MCMHWMAYITKSIPLKNFYEEVSTMYHIMQIVRGGKVSRLYGLLVIHGKTFAIVQQFEAPYNKK